MRTVHLLRPEHAIEIGDRWAAVETPQAGDGGHGSSGLMERFQQALLRKLVQDASDIGARVLPTDLVSGADSIDHFLQGAAAVQDVQHVACCTAKAEIHSCSV